jgi:sugar lactone lactonase YvrE
LSTDGVAVEVVVDLRCQLAESPMWDDRLGELIFVDITGEQVHRYDPETGAHRSYPVGQPVGAAAARVGPGLVLAVRHGYAALDLDSGEVTPIAEVACGDEALRTNDGKVDSAGRFWAGTLSEDGVPGAGVLYRLEPDATVTAVLTGVGVSNGMAWSLDGRTMYYIDSAAGGVDAFPFDAATGDLGERLRLIDMPGRLGVPDGMTIDEEGCLWVALYDGSQVRRYTADGTLDRVIDLPVSRVTSCAFGGPDLTELFITTALPRPGVREPLAGAVFRCRPGPRGLAAARYGG